MSWSRISGCQQYCLVYFIGFIFISPPKKPSPEPKKNQPKGISPPRPSFPEGTEPQNCPPEKTHPKFAPENAPFGLPSPQKRGPPEKLPREINISAKSYEKVGFFFYELFWGCVKFPKSVEAAVDVFDPGKKVMHPKAAGDSCAQAWFLEASCLKPKRRNTFRREKTKKKRFSNEKKQPGFGLVGII